MSENPTDTPETPTTIQTEYEKISAFVAEEFQTEESILEQGVPTYYLRQPQETKQKFLKLLNKLAPMNLIAILRRTHNGRVVLKIIPKPPVKKSNILINWGLLFATIATTFLSGYFMLPSNVIDPFVGGIAFTVTIMAVLGMHEMGHKIIAQKRGVEATPPYFIPGIPPLGTFGAVIMQKSLPPNKDALFDIGADGPITGFIVATFASIVGLMLLIPTTPMEGTTSIQIPIMWTLLARLLAGLNLFPLTTGNQILLLHPITFAGWVGLLVTMLNLLPAAMLDGGHVARSLAGEKVRLALTGLSIAYLVLMGFWPMALFVVFISMYRHPGPLDDVSSLSASRKALTVLLIVIFILCSFPPEIPVL